MTMLLVTRDIDGVVIRYGVQFTRPRGRVDAMRIEYLKPGTMLTATVIDGSDGEGDR